MRHLLQKWAELEPTECQATKLKQQTEIFFNSSVGHFTENDLKEIQWAVQQAIVSRGWGFEMSFNTDYPNAVEATVKYGVNWTSSEITDNPAKELLEAYLKALEVGQ